MAHLPDLAQRIAIYFKGDLVFKTSDYTKDNPDRLGQDSPSKPQEISAKVVLASEHSYHIGDNKAAKDIVAVFKGEISDDIEFRTCAACEQIQVGLI